MPFIGAALSLGLFIFMLVALLTFMLMALLAFTRWHLDLEITSIRGNAEPKGISQGHWKETRMTATHRSLP